MLFFFCCCCLSDSNCSSARVHLVLFFFLTFPQFSLWLKVFFVDLHSFPGAYVCVFLFFSSSWIYTCLCSLTRLGREINKKRKRVDADLKK